jgi:DnaJ like chaperone protein
MKWWGKLLGGTLGYALGDIIGAIIGVVLGHQLDRTTISPGQRGFGFDREKQEQTQKTFFNTTFSVLGHISKSDGRVSQQEIHLAEQVMKRMNLSQEQRIAAIELFNLGKQADFNLGEVLTEFRERCSGKTALIQMFIEIQLQAAYADGSKNSEEERILQHICRTLGYPEVLLLQLESMLFASRRRKQSSSTNGFYTSSTSALEDAYKIIGVDKTASDAEVKKAYRKLMSQNHPDKLISKGLPEEMIEIATNKTQEIQKAYDLIADSRG